MAVIPSSAPSTLNPTDTNIQYQYQYRMCCHEFSTLHMPAGTSLMERIKIGKSHN